MASADGEKRDGMSRREALQRLWICAQVGAVAVPLGLAACSNGGNADDPAVAQPPAAAPPAAPPVVEPPAAPPPAVPPAAPPAPDTPLARLQATLRSAVAPAVTTQPITVTQGAAHSADPSIGSDAAIFPAPRGALNPNPVSLATLPEVWGYRRDTWGEGFVGYIGSAAGNDSWYVPLARWHRAATLSAFSTCGLHFVFDGRAFEMLFAGDHTQITLFADGKLMAPQYITTALHAGVPDAPLSAPNAYVKFDFGYAARREISLYAASSQGPCAIAIGKDDALEPWDRTGEASFCALTDSYGQAAGVNWPLGGPFWEAATLLGIAHLDLDAIGGTGFAPNPGSADARVPGNAFGARIASGAATAPDLFVTAGSINDNNFMADPPLYGSTEEAKAGFDAAVSAYFRDLRAALPASVLAAMGPWAPVETMPVNAIAQSKADSIRSALRAAGGPWVFLDNLNGGWLNSAGAFVPPTGRGWQTGTGTVARPQGDGNGDLYVAADGVHPTPAGCLYLGQILAANLKDAILAL
jgi:hypothetical protein